MIRNIANILIILSITAPLATWALSDSPTYDDIEIVFHQGHKEYICRFYINNDQRRVTKLLVNDGNPTSDMAKLSRAVLQLNETPININPEDDRTYLDLLNPEMNDILLENLPILRKEVEKPDGSNKLFAVYISMLDKLQEPLISNRNIMNTVYPDKISISYVPLLYVSLSLLLLGIGIRVLFTSESKNTEAIKILTKEIEHAQTVIQRSEKNQKDEKNDDDDDDNISPDLPSSQPPPHKPGSNLEIDDYNLNIAYSPI